MLNNYEMGGLTRSRKGSVAPHYPPEMLVPRKNSLNFVTGGNLNHVDAGCHVQNCEAGDRDSCQQGGQEEA